MPMSARLAENYLNSPRRSPRVYETKFAHNIADSPLTSSADDDTANEFEGSSSVACTKMSSDQDETSSEEILDIDSFGINRQQSKLRKRYSSAKSNKSDVQSKSFLFGAITRRIKLESSWLIPLSPVPFRQSGVAWNGVYRRTPILIFSPTVMMSKDSSVKAISENFNLSFKVTRAECRLLRSLLKSHGFCEVNGLSSEFNLMWTNNHVKPIELRSLYDFQRVNHFPKSYELTRKDRLAQNVKRMQLLKGEQQFDIIPKTFVLPSELADLRTDYAKGHGPYIVKPVASSRGRGIHIINNPDALTTTDQVIVSRYVSNPLLIDGFKFDLRLYVAVTSYSPLFIYIYEEGLARFATVRYQKGTKHYKNLCMHLTNYSVNKKNHHFVHNDDADIEDFGNKWSLGALLRYLRSEGKDTAALMLRIEDIIIKAFVAVEDQINYACRLFMSSKSNCFELYGFDIIVDENLRPWLLEVNLSPSLACDTPLDFKVKSNMLSDLLNLAGIVCYDPTKRNKRGISCLQNFVSPKHPTYFVAAIDYLSEECQPRSSKNTRRQLRPVGSSDAEPVSSLTRVQSKVASSTRDLTPNEQRLIRRLQEETARSGGWLRLFPCSETWDQYAGLLYNNGATEPTVSQPQQWRLSISVSPVNNQAPLGVSSTTKTGRRVDENFAVHASATMAVLAMQKANLHTLESTSKRNETDVTLVHPNLIPPNIHVGLFTGLVTSSNECCSSLRPRGSDETKLLVHVPPLYANDVTYPPIHSLPSSTLAEFLMIVLGFDLDKSRSRRKQAESVVACYSQTLARLPFYHRKLGALPICVRGVCLLAGCDHTLERSRLCGMRSNSERRVLPQVLLQVAKSAKAPPAVNDSMQLYKREVTSLLNSAKIKSMSQRQARSAFCAYLSRIRNRIASQLMDTGASRKADNEADLILRFLQKAALKLSPHAIKSVCRSHDGDTNIQRMVAHGVFKIPDFPPNYNLQSKWRLLITLLENFIKIYRYETSVICNESPHLNEAGVDKLHFNHFIQHATENELETVLSQYTRFYHSMSLFSVPPLRCTPIPRESGKITPKPMRSINQMNSNKPIQRSLTFSASDSSQLKTADEHETILLPQATSKLAVNSPPETSGRLARNVGSPVRRKNNQNSSCCLDTNATVPPKRGGPATWTTLMDDAVDGQICTSQTKLSQLGSSDCEARLEPRESPFEAVDNVIMDGDYEAAFYDPSESIHSVQLLGADEPEPESGGHVGGDFYVLDRCMPEDASSGGFDSYVCSEVDVCDMSLQEDI
uniref:Tubulin--tyrosine ligase-like protein 5 n=1 Tax=Mesocestoides corti TaxID=53468 RepID=A0A5K3FN36_MESCO